MEFCPECGGMMLPFEEEIIIEDNKEDNTDDEIEDLRYNDYNEDEAILISESAIKKLEAAIITIEGDEVTWH